MDFTIILLFTILAFLFITIAIIKSDNDSVFDLLINEIPQRIKSTVFINEFINAISEHKELKYNIHKNTCDTCTYFKYYTAISREWGLYYTNLLKFAFNRSAMPNSTLSSAEKRLHSKYAHYSTDLTFDNSKVNAYRALIKKTLFYQRTKTVSSIVNFLLLVDLPLFFSYICVDIKQNNIKVIILVSQLFSLTYLVFATIYLSTFVRRLINLNFSNLINQSFFNVTYDDSKYKPISDSQHLLINLIFATNVKPYDNYFDVCDLIKRINFLIANIKTTQHQKEADVLLKQALFKNDLEKQIKIVTKILNDKNLKPNSQVVDQVNSLLASLQVELKDILTKLINIVELEYSTSQFEASINNEVDKLDSKHLNDYYSKLLNDKK
ncbi:hypothetical protein [Lactobacillus johnsonii]|uniref:Uncharacterized protein n=1 Tax=Lactobacillus johnsonii TaxID=33959 RepID=A0AAW5LSY8_LACJH|nr:hypothetical protein [Lactobacillus johnsonii]MCR1915417.1 hypothetical protein [Lactobacillus johnsonii]